MRRFLLARDVQPLLDALAVVARGAVLLDAAGDLIWQAGDHEGATLDVPVNIGDARATLAVPPQYAVFGELGAAALERIAAARAAIDDLAATTRRLWREQNLLFTVGELLRHGFGDADIRRWLVDRLAVIEADSVTVLSWDGKELEVAEGRFSGSFKVGDRLAPSPLASEVLDRGEPIAFTPDEGAVQNELGVRLAPGQPCLLAPMYSAETVLGLVMLLRRPQQRAFGAEEVKLVQLLSDLASMALANRRLVEEAEHTARVVREMELAAEIQERLFPPPLARYGSLEVAARCEPVTQVGGDGFIQKRLRHGGVALGVVDLTGHGIGVSLALSALFARMDALADSVDTPGELLTKVNDQLTRGEFNAFTMATAIVAFVDPDSGRFSLSTAAHPRAIVRRSRGAVETFETSGLPLGVRPGQVYPVDVGVLEPGDALVLYSDGISETMGEGRQTFGAEGVRRVLARGVTTAAAVVAAVSEEVTRFSKGSARADDRTIMVVRRAEAKSA